MPRVNDKRTDPQTGERKRGYNAALAALSDHHQGDKETRR